MVKGKKVELVSPAGNFEKLQYAIEYGADAVYAGWKNFSLRAQADNFTLSELKKAISYVHQKKKKIYLALNIFATNIEIKKIRRFIEIISDSGLDGIIVSDFGVLQIIREVNKDLPITVSTQTNTLNYKAVQFWQKQNIKRIILARELSFKELKTIRKICADIEIEIFVHGAMCISYSGRCLLSKYLTNRDANQGDCSHPCRWNYYLVEENRLNQFLQIEEEEGKTFILNSKDLCLIKRLPELIRLQIDAFKIEGRMKSIYYIAIATGVYRKVIDGIYNKEKINFDYWLNELKKISHRDYTEGFYNEETRQDMMRYETSSYIRKSQFVGNIIRVRNNNEYVIYVRNKIYSNKKYDIINPDMTIYEEQKLKFYNKKGEEIKEANPNDIIILKETDLKLKEFSLIREKIED